MAQRRTRAQAQGGAAAAEPTTFTVEVAEMLAEPVTLTVREGSKVSDVLREANVDPTGRTVTIRGQRVDLDQVVAAHDQIVVTGRIRGG